MTPSTSFVRARTGTSLASTVLYGTARNGRTTGVPIDLAALAVLR